ncbi:MAG: SpoVA/SpoVAEb family sporulation membrane protein [Clostridia bacterium]|nr:SpoVA/SpoVAEb family sporulation membrane protein [Clostridia bacterium]
MDAKRYSKLVKEITPGSPKLSGFFRAFWVGGFISMIGQGFNQIGALIGLSYQELPMFTSSLLVLIAAFLTGIGVYDKIGKYAGAGSIVPITGFANSVVSPAMEFRREGLVMGVGARLFFLAGPVLAYGISASVVYGIIYYVLEVAGIWG